ncbi:murein transglycosylase A [Pseudorhodoplanes sinuspersici]|uniref:murein transglycosylase A n=1 Tax=Pseudorhodoplanes sinuspersici TaxID=1235591 RepID=UPI0012FD3D0D|nr:MltA domain-containing protein [Pseudorhodoplanes sinuspersici]
MIGGQDVIKQKLLPGLNARRIGWAILAAAALAIPVVAVASTKPASRQDDVAKSETKQARLAKKPAKEKAAKSRKAKSVRSTKANPLKMPNSQIEPLAWHEIKGWMEDNHSDAYSAFLASCRPILKSSAKARAERGETYRALFEVCGRAMAALPLSEAGTRKFFEENFRPVRVSALGEKDGFFTGYYEPIIEGSRTKSDVYTTPLYRRPPDLVTQRLRRSHGKGKAGKRVVKRTSAPYYDRAQIEDGALDGRGLEIVWVKSPIDAFFAEIQGSVRVRLDDGKVIRLNYADKNGHAYTAVGRFLIERGYVSKEEISMQKIREYMEKFPEEGKKLRRENKSFVFFRETDLSEFEEAIGAQGISLTAARSIAVDRKLHTYGMPVFVNAYLPIASEKPDTWFRRLMIAQDTGGAIVGPARADIYLGAGDEAERAAGRFKHPGQFVMLVPNELDPDGEADGIRLPLPRPLEASPGVVAKRTTPEAEVKPDPKLASSAADASLTTGSIGASKAKRIVNVPLPKTRPDRQTP